MVSKCANSSCSVLQTKGGGKLFRVDLEIANTAGETELKTAYLWLCESCARQMNPDVSVAGDRVLLRLAIGRPKANHDNRQIPRVN